MRPYSFCLIAAISLCAYSDAVSKRARSTFVTSITSDEHDIPVQRSLRDGTKTTKEERTNGTNLSGTNQNMSIRRWRSETLLWYLWIGEDAVNDILFLEPLWGWQQTAEHIQSENMGQTCDTDNLKTSYTEDIVNTKLKPELMDSWLSYKIVDDVLSCWSLTMTWNFGL